MNEPVEIHTQEKPELLTADTPWAAVVSWALHKLLCKSCGPEETAVFAIEGDADGDAVRLVFVAHLERESRPGNAKALN